MADPWYVEYRRHALRRRQAQVLRYALLLVVLGAVVVGLAYVVGRDRTTRFYPTTGGVAGASTASSTPPAESAMHPRLTARGSDVLARRSLVPLVGHYVTAHGVAVRQVVGNEEFWVGRSPRQRVLVHLESRGESGARIRRGERVTFVGVVARNDRHAAAEWGIVRSEGSALLKRQGAHVVARASRVRVAP